MTFNPFAWVNRCFVSKSVQIARQALREAEEAAARGKQQRIEEPRKPLPGRPAQPFTLPKR